MASELLLETAVTPIPMRPSRLGIVLSRIGIPLAAFLLSHLVFYAEAHAAKIKYDSGAFVRADSLHYLALAQGNYAMSPCPTQFAPRAWCGSPGWLPGYPMAVRAAFKLLQITPQAAGIAVTNAFDLGMILLLWNAFFFSELSSASIACLVLATFFPGCIYFAAVFPFSMALFFMILSIYLLQKKRWLFAGVAGGVAAFAYPSALLFSGVAVLWISTCVPELRWQQRIRAVAITGGLVALGFAAVLLFDLHKTGHWDAFFLIQSRFKHTIHLPFGQWARKTSAFLLGVDRLATPRWDDVGVLPALQTLFVAILVVTAIWSFLASGNKTKADWLLAIYVVAFWIFPWCVGAMSQYRSETLLMPVAILCRRLPVNSIWILASFAVFIAAPMAALFFRGVLI